MTRIGRLVAIVTIALGTLLHASACGSDARAVDACRQIESARCDRGPACIPDFEGTSDSCRRFYDVQCGRGVPEAAKEPSRAELQSCLAAIKNPNDCQAVLNPVQFCPFLIANDQPAVTDTGAAATPDAAAEAAADAPTD